MPSLCTEVITCRKNSTKCARRTCTCLCLACFTRQKAKTAGCVSQSAHLTILWAPSRCHSRNQVPKHRDAVPSLLSTEVLSKGEVRQEGKRFIVQGERAGQSLPRGGRGGGPYTKQAGGGARGNICRERASWVPAEGRALPAESAGKGSQAGNGGYLELAAWRL